jgi:hypothetical protein
MINFLNNALTFILGLDFLQRRFPKIEKICSDIYIFINSYFEVQMIRNGIEIFSEPQIEKVDIDNDFRDDNKEMCDIVNKYRTFEKEKYF